MIHMQGITGHGSNLHSFHSIVEITTIIFIIGSILVIMQELCILWIVFLEQINYSGTIKTKLNQNYKDIRKFYMENSHDKHLLIDNHFYFF